MIKVGKRDAMGNVISTEETFVGRVVEVRNTSERRNMSDTLDYSDWQQVACTTAIVYLGRVVPAPMPGCTRTWVGTSVLEPGSPLELEKRFQPIDCSNHFAWRGESLRTADVDADMQNDVEMYADWRDWTVLLEQRRLESERYIEELEAKRAEEDRLREVNRPVVGKQMRVVKGRKVPVGTVGTVAYVSGSGSVLLKDDASWRDRASQGRWVDGSYLVVR